MSDGFDEMIDTGRGFFAELASNNNRDWFEPRNGVRPRRWTGSGGGFDRGAGVAVLELDGAEIAQGGV
jgi:hypothetical protein